MKSTFVFVTVCLLALWHNATIANIITEFSENGKIIGETHFLCLKVILAGFITV